MGYFPELYQIDPVEDQRWEELVLRHPCASIFHSTRWLGALRSAYGYRPLAFTTSPPGTPLANGIPFCDVNSWLTGRRLVSLPFSDHCEPLVSPELEGAEFGAIWNRPRHDWMKYLSIRPIVFRPSPAAPLERDATFLLHRLDLCPDLDTLHGRFHKSCLRRAIHRAEREKVEITEGNSPELLREFYRLFTLTRRRHGAPPQPLNWFRTMIASFGKDLTIWVASKDGRAVAAVITLTFKKTMVYKYGGSDPAARNLGCTPLLFWRAIQKAKANGLEVFDMGRSDPANLGLVVFKERWGATPVFLQYWRSPGKRVQRQTSQRLAEQAASACSPSVLQLIGSLLYRHIG